MDIRKDVVDATVFFRAGGKQIHNESCRPWMKEARQDEHNMKNYEARKKKFEEREMLNSKEKKTRRGRRLGKRRFEESPGRSHNCIRIRWRCPMGGAD